ncbi:heat-inducible transcriptional repressor HrcA [Neomicrococcus lactis]|uniref:heat-inducible transcriptional repressor HrcA n=1 Tax=Neomicrococcus lactis TaxID=732241 RepID=UPI0022FFEC55|nr:heat-inducible transcriptional repressor HrcA [Neomicrococcus lactis]
MDQFKASRRDTSKTEPRRLEVLRAIVEDFVQTREPVGSKALVERHLLDVSAATIRNDMAALEDEGFIVAPHTSAGRIPTEKGYRHFVDMIEEVRPLSAAERRAFQFMLEGAEDVDEILDRTVRMLAQITQQVAVLQVPIVNDDDVRHLELVSLGATQALIVLISSTGKVEQRVIVVPASTTDELLSEVRTAILSTIQGKPMMVVGAEARVGVTTLPFPLRELGELVAAGLEVMANQGNSSRYLVAGTGNLARSTSDFQQTITPILDTLEEQVVLLRLLSELEQDAHGIAVSIGHENSYGGLSEASLVASSYGPGQLAKLGVLGPTRMDYPASMAAVRAVARYLSRILAS